jgi:hypothetical protein
MPLLLSMDGDGHFNRIDILWLNLRRAMEKFLKRPTLVRSISAADRAASGDEVSTAALTIQRNGWGPSAPLVFWAVSTR